MHRSLFALGILAIVLLLPHQGSCVAPELTLAARLKDPGSTLALTLTPASSAAGCAYTVYGSSSAAEFEEGASGGSALATFPASESVTKRSARNLNLINRARVQRPKVSLRAKVTCGAESGFSNVVTLNLRTASGLNSVSRWLRQAGTALSSIKVKAQRAFSNLSFSLPLALVSPGDGSRRLFAVEQGGKIFVFRNSDSVRTKTLFLDLSSRIVSGGELGLLGLAFHPQFASNGKFYVNYTEPRPDEPAANRSVIAGFTVTPSTANVTDVNTEQRYIVLNQPFDNHNGGDLAFGPDGFLYVGFGDGGSGGDPQGNGQDRTTLLGKILRIDVDNTEGSLTYAIPAGNPYKGNDSGFREEIFAYGLRNPFRFSFDFPSERLWVGDVGQGALEEIDLVTSGGNYGWNIMEGSQCYPPGSTCSSTGLELPITEYGRTVGQSIIGGYVYNGRLVPNLKGQYVFGDFVSGVVFSLVYDGATATRRKILSTDFSISSFGRDENGEVYIVSYSDGQIYRIEPR